MKKALYLTGIVFLFCLFPALGQQTASPRGTEDLTIRLEDLRIEQGVDGGFHLFIKKKPGLGSVLLAESTRDPALREDNYAYRAPEWNKFNGDEIRLIDGVPIPKEEHIYSLIDSTPENHPELGEAFHIYIPYLINYGYENTRHGEVYVVDGTYFNIRTFTLPYGDYRDSFRDNPFVLHVSQKPLEGPPEGNFMKDTVVSYREIAEMGKGDLIYSLGPQDLVDKIKTALEKEKGKSVDLVICLDTTASMKDDLDAVKRMLIPMLKDVTRDFKKFRIGMVLYKDYLEEYLTKTIPFTTDLSAFQRTLNSLQARGGEGYSRGGVRGALRRGREL